MAKTANWTKRKLFQISGGEPLIDMDRISEFFDNIDDDITVNLNTSLPKTAFNDKERLYKIFDRCNMIEISCQGTCNEDDEKTYKSKLGYDKYAFIIEIAKRYADKIHINYILDKNKVHTIKDIEDYIRFFYDNGIKNFYIKEMGKTSPGKLEDYISINEILKNSGIKKLGSSFSYGCRPDITSLFSEKFPGIFIKCKRWCYFEGGDMLTWIDMFKLWLNLNFREKKASIVLNENGKFSEWFIS